MEKDMWETRDLLNPPTRVVGREENLSGNLEGCPIKNLNNVGLKVYVTGVKWLTSLGPTWVNWQNQVMRFKKGGETLTLKGNPTLDRSLVSLKLMMKTLRNEGQGVLIELENVEAENKGSKTLSNNMEKLIKEYEAVFCISDGLPPKRGREHGIVLKQGVEPINVRPYRYPQYQKDEIENCLTDKRKLSFVNRTIEQYLRCFTSNKPRLWKRWLAWAEYWYKTTYHSSICCSPFKALYGRDAPTILQFKEGSTVVPTVEQMLKDIDDEIDLLRMFLMQAQHKMKQSADGHKEVNFDVGDTVFLKLRPYRQKSLKKSNNQKLSARFYGPFKVVGKVGRVGYRLELPASTRLHPVFHVSQLRRATGQCASSTIMPNQLNDDTEMIVEPEDILQVRTTQDGRQEALIKWKNLLVFEASWEDCEALKMQFPSFHLEDKMQVLRGGIDRL
ncbi:uncharacterized protein LOC112505432 [Cynara cardunculus var. scolymus]|uniref:uncharacterized protein LOC112505432 n=1 Tax=Cynara cardunculus var. scolymus TaxID=59895 RepID=UPI000D627B31|nr:uncharacterized protein LOC112505432 [Cynara cardunculus var. scolymus]